MGVVGLKTVAVADYSTEKVKNHWPNIL